MSKVAILGDTHFGVRSDSPAFHEYYRKFYTEVFFPYLKENNIHWIIQTGDLFDRRKYVNFQTLAYAREYFFDRLVENKINLITYLGNHDVYYRNTLALNSPDLLLGEYIRGGDGCVQLITKPTNRYFGSPYFDNGTVDFIPWICEDNAKEVSDFVSKSESKICFGHFQILGFEWSIGDVCIEGVDPSYFDKYSMVISGHFHHRSNKGNIWYVGAPAEHTWSDYGSKKGFTVMDTNTRKMTFVENPYHMFNKIVYNEDNIVSEHSLFKDTYVKVIVEKKTDPYKFEQFMNNLFKVNPIDVAIVTTDLVTPAEIKDIDKIDDTGTILEKYIEAGEFQVNKDSLKQVIKKIYNEAARR